MSAEIATTVITVSGGLAVAGATYWFTKKREREADLRKEKLQHYKDFVAALSGVISGESTPDAQRAFSRACNSLNLIAPQAVIKALREFQEEIKVSNTDRSKDRHDRLMSRLFLEIRRDLQVAPNDDESTFAVGLFASGVPADRS
ncbi:MAG TPA: hypothetical protein VG055_11685 [Planctomycetaceae bacterium]|jgi:hypothetical protein|nr:hypothetical protein [Planctomycetaceae bacterium]